MCVCVCVPECTWPDRRVEECRALSLIQGGKAGMWPGPYSPLHCTAQASCWFTHTWLHIHSILGPFSPCRQPPTCTCVPSVHASVGGGCKSDFLRARERVYVSAHVCLIEQTSPKCNLRAINFSFLAGAV